jgi:Tfp pilus assembly protein PilN
MIPLGYAAAENDSVRIGLLEGGSPLDDGRRVGAILLSRLDFDVQILDVPHLPDKELEGFVRYRLRSLYPGNPKDTVFDYRVEREGQRRQVVVFIARQALLERYRGAADGTPLLLPYSLLHGVGRLEKNCRIWFCHSEWAELMVFRAGFLVTSTVFVRGKKSSLNFLRNEERDAEETQSLPVLVFAAQADVQGIKRLLGNSLEVRVQSFDELSSLQRKGDGVFQEHRKRPRIPRAVQFAAISFFIAAMAVLLLFKQVWREESGIADLRKVHTQLEIQSRTALALQKDVDDLQAELARLNAAEPVDAYRFLSELSRVLGENVQIRSIDLQGNAFRIEATGANPLRLMEGFQNNGLFKAVKLSQVVPDARTDRERFSFSGVYDVH